MKAVVVANGDALPADRAHAVSADLLIAADGGALLCSRWDLPPRIVVGDLDSLGVERAEELRQAGVQVVAYAADKDESDTELAVRWALEAGADEIVLVAGLGGQRLDHEVANVLLVADPRLAGRIRAVRGDTTLSALHSGGSRLLSGVPGDIVTLLPIGGVSGVTTDGLRYPLRGEALRAGAARGLSNVLERPDARVSVAEGALIVIEISRGGVA